MLLSLLLLVACGAKDDAPADTGNPIVPDEYEGTWDVEATSCAGADAVVYFTFDGQIDDGGSVTGTQTWYWFWVTEGWDGDCTDRFSMTGADSSIRWQEPPCSDCERELEVDLELADSGRGCPAVDYEDYFDNDNVDADAYHMVLGLDSLDGSDPWPDAGLTVTAGFRDDDHDDQYTFVEDYAFGHYHPSGDDYEDGAASFDYVIPERICAVLE